VKRFQRIKRIGVAVVILAAVGVLALALHQHWWRSVDVRTYRNGIWDPNGAVYVSSNGDLAIGLSSIDPRARVQYIYEPRYHVICTASSAYFHLLPGGILDDYGGESWPPIEPGKSHDPKLSVTRTMDGTRIQFDGMYGETTRVEVPIGSDPALDGTATGAKPSTGELDAR
jgi:hypothetical protein